MNTILVERMLAITLARRAALAREAQAQAWETMPNLPSVPTKRQARAGRKLARRIVRRAHREQSMMHMGAPAGHRVVGTADERTKILLAKWRNRIANKRK